MQPATAAYRRARSLLRIHPLPFWTAMALAVLEALLFLALLVVGGLLAGLLVTRGVTHLARESPAGPPRWLRVQQVPETAARDLWLSNTGLTGLAVANRGPASPARHRWLAGRLLGVIGRIRPLRTDVSALATLLAVGLGLLLAILLCSVIRRRITIRLAAEAAAALRRRVHRQMYRVGLSALPSQGIGPVLDLFTREVSDIGNTLALDLNQTVRLPVLAGGMLLVALAISMPLAVFLLALPGVSLLLTRPLIRAARAEAEIGAREAAIQLCLLHEDLGLVRTVRVYGMEGVDKDRFDKHLASYQQADVRRMRSEDSVDPTLLLVIGAGAAVAVSMLGYLVLTPGPARLSLAAVLTVLAALVGAAWLVPIWLDSRRAIRQAGRSATAVFDYLDRRPELTMAVGARFLPPMRDRVTFEDVRLEGPNGRAILDGIAAEIPAHTRTSILSQDHLPALALACLVPRLIDPTVGRVRIDGIDLRDVTLESLRAQVATVLQADFIFSDSVLANISLGDPSFTFPRVIQAAKMAHAHNFIQNLPRGYETVIGPLGHGLQPDEQYRIALARAFLHDPAIVIIEEPEGPISDEIKPLLDDTIDRLAQDRTLIFLTHRLATLRKSDRVILLQHGRVEGIGPHRQLYEDSKLYRHIQYLESTRHGAAEVEVGTM